MNVIVFKILYQGKTLSIICGAVRWLLDHENREWNQLKRALELLAMKNGETNNDDDDDDWIAGQAKLAEQQRKVYEINNMLKSLEDFNNNIEKIKKVGISCYKNLFE